MNLALYEAVSVLAAITKEFDLSFAPGYLQRTEMVDIEFTPRYQGALTLSMKVRVQSVRSS